MMSEASQCPRCGCKDLVLLRTLNQKRCPCSPATVIPWELGPGQEPVGYSISPELTRPTLAANIHITQKSGSIKK